MTTTRTNLSLTRTPKDMRPMSGCNISFILYVCNKARTKGNHDQRSKIRQAAGFIINWRNKA